MYTTKTEIKQAIKEELKCPTDFIERCLNAEGRIDELKDATHEADREDIMNVIYDEYRQYCKAWDLDYEADNRKLKSPIVNR